MTAAERRARFHELHASDGIFVMPNPWDVGSARLLASLGFEALATTSAGFAATLGRLDMKVTRRRTRCTRRLADRGNRPADERRLRAVLRRRRGGHRADGRTVGQLAGAAGCSIEDWNPATDAHRPPIDVATERVAAAAGAANAAPAMG